jgi:hypothetical protein
VIQRSQTPTFSWNPPIVTLARRLGALIAAAAIPAAVLASPTAPATATAAVATAAVRSAPGSVSPVPDPRPAFGAGLIAGVVIGANGAGLAGVCVTATGPAGHGFGVSLAGGEP